MFLDTYKSTRLYNPEDQHRIAYYKVIGTFPNVFMRVVSVNRRHLRQDAGGCSGPGSGLGVRWWRSHQTRRGHKEDPGVRVFTGKASRD